MEEAMNVPKAKMKKIAGYVDPIIRHARYLLPLRRLEEKNFRNEISQLKDAHMSVKLQAKVATMRNEEEITRPVKKWLKEVENILEEAQKLEERLEEAAKNKFFHNVSVRHSLAKQVASKTQQMMKLRNNSEFHPFSLPLELQDSHYLPSPTKFVYFKSTESASDKLLEAIKDDKSNKIIGLYGVGGSGKSTLAEEIGKKVEMLKLYHKVVMAVIPQPLNMKNIQDQILDQLGLKIDEQSVKERALELSERLRDGRRRTLIILDDVCEDITINLEDIGIPLSSKDDIIKSCCVLLVTRFQSVCISMGCQTTVELSLLTDEEAWTLLKLYSYMSEGSPKEFLDIARNIADECKGLPIAIEIMGRKLKEIDYNEWKLVLSRLKDQSQSMDIEEDLLRIPYACIELSYDHLRNDIAKSLFLLCSIFPKCYQINREELVRFGKGILELDETIDTMAQVRREIHKAINILLDSCLLMLSNNKQACVQMHDLVRDVALWIAAKERRKIVVDSQVFPRTVNDNGIAEGIEALSLWDLKRNYYMHFPTLKILLLHSQESFEEGNTYLEGMEALKVLALVRYSFQWDIQLTITWPIPFSLASLKSLHTLCLRGSNLGDISIVCNLKGLEILDLRGSCFDQLPNEIVGMKKLKLLDLFGCIIVESPYEVIERCSQLQELYIWDPESASPENVCFPELQRYAICVSFNGESMFHQHREIEASRSLSMEGYNISALSSSMKDLCLEADMLCLENCKWKDEELFSKVKYVMIEQCSRINMFAIEEQRLEEVDLCNCPELKTIFITHARLPKLRRLHIRQCNELEGIISADFHSSLSKPSSSSSSDIDISFPKLEEILIINCNKLKAVFSYVLACHCPSLEFMMISECSELEMVVHGFEGGEDENGVLFPKLSKLILTELPELTHFLSTKSPTQAQAEALPFRRYTFNYRE